MLDQLGKPTNIGVHYGGPLCLCTCLLNVIQVLQTSKKSLYFYGNFQIQSRTKLGLVKEALPPDHRSSERGDPTVNVKSAD